MLHDAWGAIRSAWDRSWFRWSLLLAIIGLILRLMILWAYQPIEYGDSSSYFRLAEVLRENSFAGYDASRVPAYPLFLILAGLDPTRVWSLQLLLGWLISLMLFWLGWRTTGSHQFGFLLGLAYDLIPGQILFESTLLTETLTTFWLILTFVLLKGMEVARKSWMATAIAFGLGVAVSLAGLTRPLFYPLSLGLLFILWVMMRKRGSTRILFSVAYSVAPLLLLGGWLLFVYFKYGMLSPSTLSGYSSVQHTGEYFEFLPDDEAVIRDTYIEFRDAQLAQAQTQTNAIWEAIPAMTEASGLNFFSLSRKLQSLSYGLIREHPDLYLSNVFEGWVNFWKAPVYWRPDQFNPAAIRTGIQILALLGRGVSLTANGLFLLLALGSAMFRTLREKLSLDIHTLAVGGTILLSSFLQTLVDHGDNPRFLVPLQILVIYLVMRTFWFWFGDRG